MTIYILFNLLAALPLVLIIYFLVFWLGEEFTGDLKYEQLEAEIDFYGGKLQIANGVLLFINLGCVLFALTGSCSGLIVSLLFIYSLASIAFSGMIYKKWEKTLGLNWKKEIMLLAKNFPPLLKILLLTIPCYIVIVGTVVSEYSGIISPWNLPVYMALITISMWKTHFAMNFRDYVEIINL